MTDEFDREIEERYAGGIKRLAEADPVIVDRLAASIAELPGRSSWRFWRRPSAASALFRFGAVVAVVVVALGAYAIGTAPPTAGPSSAPSAAPTARSSEAPSSSLTADGIVPWIDATPSPAPTPEPTPDPRSYPPCTASDLALDAGGWSGATGLLEGGASVINVTQNPCTVSGIAGVELLDAEGRVVATGDTVAGGSNDGTVVVPSGGVAVVTIVWGNWCGAPPPLPVSIRLSLPAASGMLTSGVRVPTGGPFGEVPRCDNPGGGSSLDVLLPFAAPGPSSGGYQPSACVIDGLTAYLGDWGQAAGTSYAPLVVHNVGGVDCLLDTTPTFEVRAATGGVVVVVQPDSPPAGASTILLPAGWAAVATIGYADWCTEAPALPLHADLLISNESLSVEALAPIPLPPCMAQPATPAPEAFYETAFATPGTPAAPEPDRGNLLPVSVTLSPLPATAPGSVLEYSVTLTNIDPYQKPASLLAGCPSYTERLFLPGTPAAIETNLALNCDPVPVLEAGTPITFAMRLPVPADAPPGTATLIWQLGTSGAAAPKATFQISAGP